MKNIMLILISTLISLVAAELVFRWMIFGSSKAFQNLRNPGLYSNEKSEDYWKLYYRLNGFFKPPANPHPLLGWVGRFDRDNYEHRYTKNAGTRRPVLIYGDSFIQCIDTVQCFQDILNSDSAFNQKHYLLNYGVGGYGVDQIYLLCSLSVRKYVNPFVIFSIMPTDMDRCILSVRTGQKPYFADEDGRLVLKGVPINPNPDNFFKQNPPSIVSYMYARFLHSDLNKFISLKEREEKVRDKIRDLNEKIILKADSELKSSHVDYAFMIFDNLYNEDGDWRLNFLLNFLNERNIPYIYTAELIDQDKNFSEFNFDRYIISGDGHPTSYYNKLVAQEIKNFVFDYRNYSAQKAIAHKALGDTTSVSYFERKIKLDRDWLRSVKEKAEKRNIPLDSMIRLDAIWLKNNKHN